MQKRSSLLVPLALAVAAALSLAFAQERVKKKEAKDFEGVHASLGEAWKAGQYGRCVDLARDLIGIVNAKRTELILAAMPGAPEGFELVPDEKANNAQSNPFASAIAASVGSVIERKYRKVDGRGSIEITVTAGSPIVQMFKMWVTNPQMLGPDAELVKYGQYDAVLKKESGRWMLQILIGDDLCEVKLAGGDDDFLLRFMNQSAVDALAKALAA